MSVAEGPRVCIERGRIGQAKSTEHLKTVPARTPEPPVITRQLRNPLTNGIRSTTSPALRYLKFLPVLRRPSLPDDDLDPFLAALCALAPGCGQCYQGGPKQTQYL